MHTLILSNCPLRAAELRAAKSKINEVRENCKDLRETARKFVDSCEEISFGPHQGMAGPSWGS